MNRASSSNESPHVATANVDGRQSMQRNGKSFWFASFFLPRAIAADAAQLYAFCRTMDDLADESDDPGAASRLLSVRQDLQRGRSDDPQVKGLLALSQRHPIRLEVADHLVAAFVEDASIRLQLKTENELIRYCFGVAGTVGLMMSSILGADPHRARLYAADLGIAMQMTNIARDVLEDARNGRRYLPAGWIGNISPAQIVNDLSCRAIICEAIARLLDLADVYYASASSGFDLIPRKSRKAIEIAATVYREIGVSLRASGLEWWGARSVVPTSRKVFLASTVLAGSSRLRRLPSATDSQMIHQALAGLPGAA